MTAPSPPRCARCGHPRHVRQGYGYTLRRQCGVVITSGRLVTVDMELPKMYLEPVTCDCPAYVRPVRVAPSEESK